MVDVNYSQLQKLLLNHLINALVSGIYVGLKRLIEIEGGLFQYFADAQTDFSDFALRQLNQTLKQVQKNLSLFLHFWIFDLRLFLEEIPLKLNNEIFEVVEGLLIVHRETKVFNIQLLVKFFSFLFKIFDLNYLCCCEAQIPKYGREDEVINIILLHFD